MKKAYVAIFFVLLSTYIILAFTLPTDPQVLSKYGMSQTQSRLLSLTTVIPLALVYLAALYGFITFYVSCIVLTWWYYARRNAPMPC